MVTEKKYGVNTIKEVCSNHFYFFIIFWVIYKHYNFYRTLLIKFGRFFKVFHSSLPCINILHVKEIICSLLYYLPQFSFPKQQPHITKKLIVPNNFDWFLTLKKAAENKVPQLHKFILFVYKGLT